MLHPILKVEKNSPAYYAGLEKGDALAAIDGADVLDEIDYQALSAPARITLTVRTRKGDMAQVPIEKAEGEPLGLRFGESLTLSPRPCKNHCRFCFIDQMPPGLRNTLYVKDDDWRYSLMMGNYVTLTNVDDAEFERIVARRASPLYVSVHAHSPEARVALMRNPAAARLWPRLERLKAEGLQFHAQIVCCPGYNDGEVLLDTVRALRALAPAARGVAVVPVGLTRYRDKLDKLTPFDAPRAAALLDALTPLQAEYQRELGHAFVFPSDEFYCLSGHPVPPADWYAGYPQIENGVGLLRLLADELAQAAADAGDAPLAFDPLNQTAEEATAESAPAEGEGSPPARPASSPAPSPLGSALPPAYTQQNPPRAAEGGLKPEGPEGPQSRATEGASNSPHPAPNPLVSAFPPARTQQNPPRAAEGGPKPEGPKCSYLLLTGKSAAPYLARLCAAYAPPGVCVDVRAVPNRFFGESVTVTGLLTGGDVLAALPADAKRRYRALLLSTCMLRHEGDRFLDDITLRAFRRRCPVRVRLVGPGGADLYKALRG